MRLSSTVTLCQVVVLSVVSLVCAVAPGGAAGGAVERVPDLAPDHSLDALRTRIAAARARIDAQTKLYHDPVGPRTWIDGARLWYAESSPSGERRWWLVDARAEGAAARRPLFDHDEAARLLPPPDGGAVSAARLPVQGVAVENGMVVVSFESVERPKVFDLETGRHRADAEAGSDAAAALELRLHEARPELTAAELEREVVLCLDRLHVVQCLTPRELVLEAHIGTHASDVIFVPVLP